MGTVVPPRKARMLIPWATTGLLAFAGSAAPIWAAIGFGLATLVATWPALVALSIYSLWYGFGETQFLPRRLPGSRWAVPSSFIVRRGNTGRTLLWGVFLGPGLITRNPYASMWALPLMLAAIESDKFAAAVGLAVGAGHGLARFATILRPHNCDIIQAPQSLMNKRLQRQRLDGLILLFVGGLALGLLTRLLT